MHTVAIIRKAIASDAEAISDVYLTSFKRFLPFVKLAHSDFEVRAWIANHILVKADVRVAIVDNKIIGMMALKRGDNAGWIDQLYLHPDEVGKGIGTHFVEMAKATLGSPIRLYTFQANAGARRFYERHGFKAVTFGDGSGNEENCPDILFEWKA